MGSLITAEEEAVYDAVVAIGGGTEAEIRLACQGDVAAALRALVAARLVRRVISRTADRFVVADLTANA